MRNRLLIAGIFLLPAFLMLAPAARGGQAQGTTILNDVRVESIGSDLLSIDVTTPPQMTPSHFLVHDAALQDALKGLHRGDHLSVLVSTDESDQKILQAMSVKTTPVGPGRRIRVLFGSAVAFWLVCFLLSGFHPQRLVVGEDGRYSNSKFQSVLWFSTLVITYLATIWLRAWELGGNMLGGVNMPQNLFLLSGMSALTLTAAKGITVSKLRGLGGTPAANAKPFASQCMFWSDLTHNDLGQFDLGDFQMLIMTFLAVGTFLALIFHFLGSLEARTVVNLPDVDTTILASFGLGHGAYLTKKAVGNLGDT